MNYDIDTPEGMVNAVAWLNNMLESSAKPMVMWYIPRSFAVYMIDKKAKTYTSEGEDSATEQVLAEAGFKKGT